jgi:2-dehydro-3-deoxy-D-pentonate aldolase
MPKTLSGIFVPFIVPLGEDGLIDEAELRRYLDWLIERGVHGLYANGSTGEFTRFTAEERRRIVKIACEAAAGRVPVLAGAAEANVTETLEACETYTEFGARAVAIVSPFYYRLGPEAAYTYFKEIARHSPIDITLYNIPMFATPLDVATICRLAELDRIVGIKDSSGDISFMLRMIISLQTRRPDFAFLTGWEPTLMPLLIMGIGGGTHATAGVVPELTRAIFELTTKGHLDLATKLHFRLVSFFDTLLNAGEFPAGFRAGAAARGFKIGSSRQPSCDVPCEDVMAISRTIDDILQALGNSDATAKFTT